MNQSSSPRTTAVADLHVCSRLTGWYQAFRKVTGWSILVNASPTVTEKRDKYWLVAEELQGSITRLVCSTDRVLHHEYAVYQKRLACQLATKWQKLFSIVKGWVRTRKQFTIFWAVDNSLHGTRRQIWALAFRTVQPSASVDEQSLRQYCT